MDWSYVLPPVWRWRLQWQPGQAGDQVDDTWQDQGPSELNQKVCYQHVLDQRDPDQERAHNVADQRNLDQDAEDQEQAQNVDQKLFDQRAPDPERGQHADKDWQGRKGGAYRGVPF